MIFKMKHSQSLLLAALFVVMSIGFSSCQKDDDESDSSIVGTWNLTHIKGYDKLDGVVTDQYDFDVDEINEYGTYEFHKDGTMYVETSGETAWHANYTYKNNKLTIIGDEDDEDSGPDETLTCRISGDTMTLIMEEEFSERGHKYETYSEATLKRVK